MLDNNKYKQKNNNHCLAVIGGGPVGLFLAIKLKKEGHKVQVFEKKNYPIDKVCGQGIMPRGVELLKSIGIDASEIGGTIEGIEYIDSDITLKGDLPGVGFGVKRTSLSSILFDQAMNLGVEFVFDEVIEVIEKKKITLTTKDTQHIFDFVFCCDGINSSIRKKLNFEKKLITPRIFGERMGARFHVKSIPNTRVRVYWSESSECYVTPVSRDEVEVAFLWGKDKFSKNSLKKTLINNFNIQESIPEIENISDFKAYGPFVKKAKGVRKGNVFFVGDAYCFIDGITGEGLSIGFQTAALIAQTYKHFGLIQKIIVWFHYLKYAFFIWFSLGLSKFPKVRKVIMTFLSKKQRLLNLMIKMNDYYLSSSLE